FFDSIFQDLTDKTAGLLWELQPPGVLPILEKRLSEGKLPESQRGPVVAMLVNAAGDNGAQALLRALVVETSPDVCDKIVAGLRSHSTGKWSFVVQSDDLNK